ncbi:MAG: class I SAM-dependent methyltransferase [Pseudomonadota bacterium]
MSEASWSNYWQGREGDATGALTGVESDRELQAYWSTVLSSGSYDAAFLDLACGAGTVLKQAASLGYTNLTGLDISPEAINVLKNDIPIAKTLIASASKTGLSDKTFNLVVSQFGLEYAGARAALSEAARLTAPHGRIETVMHMTGGAIEMEVQGHSDHCAELLASGFIEKASALFIGAYQKNTTDAQTLMDEMSTARDRLSRLIKPNQRSLAAHLLSGTAQLWEKRAAYALEDITGWLSGMKAEIEAYKSRMDSMISAALDQNELRACANVLQAQGFLVQTRPLSLSGAEAAWALSAHRNIEM